jgi:hypothetical protein
MPSTLNPVLGACLTITVDAVTGRRPSVSIMQAPGAMTMTSTHCPRRVQNDEIQPLITQLMMQEQLMQHADGTQGTTSHKKRCDAGDPVQTANNTGSMPATAPNRAQPSLSPGVPFLVSSLTLATAVVGQTKQAEVQSPLA